MWRKRLGYYTEAGLDVEILPNPEGGPTAGSGPAAAPNSASMPRIRWPPPLSGTARCPITAVAALLQHNTSGLISLTSDGIKHPQGP